jgi:hypothetical protein
MKIAVDASDLNNYSRKLTKAEQGTTPSLMVGLNEVGDGLVSVLSTSLSRDTGLAVEQVRGMITVKRASKNSLSYDVIVNNRLLEDDPSTLEGRRESRDFGTRQPGSLVIVVSKNDELVCMDCEELQAAGPMPIEIAREHIPKHPHCRCVIMPYVPRGRRLPVTMTSLSGTSASRRTGGRRQNADMTLRQLAQDILNKTATKIRIELK